MLGILSSPHEVARRAPKGLVDGKQKAKCPHNGDIFALL
jgi:hypothetical protein